jgi:hypothetical protein
MLDRIRNWLTNHPPRVVVLVWLLALTLLALAGMFMVRNAHAAETPVVEWSAPTKNCNGTNVPATGPTAIAKVRVEWGTCPAGVIVPETTLVLPAPDAGNSTATACFRAYATNGEGNESGPSTVSCVSFAVPEDPCVLPPPTGLRSTLTTVYETYAFGGNTYLGASIGTAPIGSACLAASYVVNAITYHAIDPALVALKRQPKAAIVTRCAQS